MLNMMLLGLILFFCFTCAYTENLPLVTTPYGKIQGTFSVSHKGEIFSQFIGIPYAQPPVGELRFEEPQPVQKWMGIWNANISIKCIQMSHEPEPEGGLLFGDENCLYLNVFVPGKNPSDHNLLDVIVHIHGGAFNFGYASSYAGPKYLMDTNVIFVAINYRLGPLGFLSTEDDVVPGNTGMKDQVAALKWIKENIKHFGGNPDSITITGLSAGGASVHYHYLSPLSKGLFNRGISVSGTVLCPWTIQEAPLQKARQLGASVGCYQKSTKDLVRCLKQRPAHQIVENVRMFRPWIFNPFSPYGLVVEQGGNKPFLPEHPYLMLSKGQVHDLPWITSVASQEGLYPAADFVLKDNTLPDLERRWEELASAVLDYNYTLPLNLHTLIAKKIKDYYFKGKTISRDTFEETVQMIGDRHFVVPSENAARMQAKANKSPVYYYYFTYPSEEAPSVVSLFTYSEEKYGVCHGDDMLLIFSSPYGLVTKMSKTDEKVKDILLKIWNSFASSGYPEVYQAKWNPVSKKENQPLDYLHIKSPDEVFMAQADEMGHRSFWEMIPFQENENLFVNKRDEL